MRHGLLCALVLCGCVQETLALGDGRGYQACEEAEEILVPASGCTITTVESTSPIGCLGTDGIDHAGTWLRVRLRERGSATVHLRVVANDCMAGDEACPTEAFLRSDPRATPCTCGQLSGVPFSVAVPITIGLESDGEVLLTPLGASFEVSVCAE